MIHYNRSRPAHSNRISEGLMEYASFHVLLMVRWPEGVDIPYGGKYNRCHWHLRSCYGTGVVYDGKLAKAV